MPDAESTDPPPTTLEKWSRFMPWQVRTLLRWGEYLPDRPTPPRAPGADYRGWRIAAFAVAGFAVIIGAVVGAVRTAAVRGGSLAPGSVIDTFHTSRSSTVRVAFTPPGLAPVRCDTDDFPGHPRIGELVTVRYDPANPTNCAVHGGEGGYVFDGLLGLAGAASATNAGRLYVLRSRRRPA